MDRGAVPVSRPTLPLSIVSLLALAVSLGTGCSSHHWVPVSDLMVESDSPLHKPSGQEIDGYTTIDDARHRFEGWVRLDGRDSLRFSSIAFEVEGTEPEQEEGTITRFTLPTSEVRSLDIDNPTH